MAMVRPRTAIVIILTLLAAAVFSLILLPRWQAKKANSSQSDQSNNLLPLAVSVVKDKVDKLSADREAIWKPQGQPVAPISNSVSIPSSKETKTVESVSSFDTREPKSQIVEEKPRAAVREEQRLVKKQNKIKIESQPQRPEDLEKTPNALKYEKLKSLLRQMHEPRVEAPVGFRNDKPKLSQVLEKETLEQLINERDRQEGKRPPGLEMDRGGVGGTLNRNNFAAPRLPPKADSSADTAMRGGPAAYRHEPTKVTTPVLTTTIATTTSPPVVTTTTTSSPPLTTTMNPVIKDLPSLTRGSAKITPERLPAPAHSSDIYYSLLTAPVYHNLRFSLQYLTWLQTVDPKQVNVVTDKDENEWIQAFKKEGGNVHIPKCPLSSRKTREMMCCKTGAQFDYWFKAREAGMNYKWYCHFDDDLYVNPQALANLLSQYDPTTEQYLGAWAVVGRVHRQNRIPGNMLAPRLHTYQERKRDDFRYANGPSYCISEALMLKVEKYLRGKNFEENCRKSDAVMDDVLPGVIIDGVLGVDLKDIAGFKSQLDFVITANSQEMKKKAEDIISIGFGRFRISDGRFDSRIDTKGVLSYHCLLHPDVSWCRR